MITEDRKYQWGIEFDDSLHYETYHRCDGKSDRYYANEIFGDHVSRKSIIVYANKNTKNVGDII